EAVAVFREVLAKMAEDAPLSVGLRNSLGAALMEKGDVEEGMALFHQNVTLGSRLAGTHITLGEGFQQLGRFAEALDSFRRAQQVAVETGSHFRDEAEKLVHKAERLVEVDRRLGAGRVSPASAQGTLEFAEVCYGKKRYTDAVEFYRRAFEW